MNGELEGTWQETVMDYPDLLVEKLTKANVNLKQLS
jgi:hypothetical protein